MIVTNIRYPIKEHEVQITKHSQSRNAAAFRSPVDALYFFGFTENSHLTSYISLALIKCD